MIEPNERDKEVYTLLLSNRGRVTDLAAYREEIEAREGGACDACHNAIAAKPAPPEAREDEAHELKCEIREALRDLGLESVYAKGVADKTLDALERLEELATLRSRQSPPPAVDDVTLASEESLHKEWDDPENASLVSEEQTTSTLDHPQQISTTENNGICPECGAPVDSFSSMHTCETCRAKHALAAAPQPSPQGEDALQREINGCSMDVINYVNALRARLSASAKDDGEMREAEVGDLIAWKYFKDWHCGITDNPVTLEHIKANADEVIVVKARAALERKEEE